MVPGFGTRDSGFEGSFVRIPNPESRFPIRLTALRIVLLGVTVFLLLAPLALYFVLPDE